VTHAKTIVIGSNTSVTPICPMHAGFDLDLSEPCVRVRDYFKYVRDSFKEDRGSYKYVSDLYMCNTGLILDLSNPRVGVCDLYANTFVTHTNTSVTIMRVRDYFKYVRDSSKEDCESFKYVRDSYICNAGLNLDLSDPLTR